MLLAQKQSVAAENYLVTRRSVALRFRYISTLPTSSVTVPYTQVFVPNSAGPAFAHPSGHTAYAQSPHVACIRSSWASTAPSVSPVSSQTPRDLRKESRCSVRGASSALVHVPSIVGTSDW